MSVFKKWSEEERRAHARARNNAYKAKKEEWTTLTEKRVKDQEKQKKLELKARVEAGEWVTIGTSTRVKSSENQENQEKKEKVMNGFSALGSDDEKEEKEEKEEKSKPNEYVRKKFNWADDSDDE